MFSSSLHGLLLFYPPCFKCSSSIMHHACNVFCEVRMWTWFEIWIMNILHQHPRHCNLAFNLVLHNLQHNITHLLPILMFGLLSFKVCMSNLNSSTTSTNGCLEAKSSCVLFVHFWWLKGNPESWANWKAQLFQQCFLFFTCTFMSLHASNENCENLIFFEFLVFSQGVNLGSITSNIHVVESSFLSFDFLDGSRVDGLSGFSHGVDQNHYIDLLKQVFFPMVFQNFE